MSLIRNAILQDIPSIRSIANRVWPIAYSQILTSDQLEYMLDKFYSKESLINQIQNLQHQFIIAEVSGKEPIGFASYSPHSDNNSIFHLHKIYVLPHHQKSNTGTRLIQYIIHDTTTKNATALQLNVNRHNNAVHFYQKLGFAIIKEEDIDIGKGYFMNDYVMEMRL